MARASWEDGHWRLAVGLYLAVALLLAAAVGRSAYYWSKDDYVLGWFDYFLTAIYAFVAVLLVIRARRQYQRGRYY